MRATKSQTTKLTLTLKKKKSKIENNSIIF